MRHCWQFVSQIIVRNSFAVVGIVDCVVALHTHDFHRIFTANSIFTYYFPNWRLLCPLGMFNVRYHNSSHSLRLVYLHLCHDKIFLVNFHSTSRNNKKSEKISVFDVNQVNWRKTLSRTCHAKSNHFVCAFSRFHKSRSIWFLLYWCKN